MLPRDASGCSGQIRIGISQNYLSTVERGKVEGGAEILLRIALEFGRTIEWLLTGEDRSGPLGRK